MIYTLAENIQIKRWKHGRAICFFTDREKQYDLDEDEVELLKRCDGKTEMKRTLLTNRLEAFRIICKCQEEKKADISRQWMEYQNYYIPALNWEITNGNEAFSPDDAFNLLDQAKECGIQNIRLAGKSMFYPHIETVMKAIHDRGMVLYELAAEGTALTREFLSAVKACNPHAWIKIPFGESEEQTLQAIRMCTEMGLGVRVEIRATRKNIDVLFAAYQTLSEMGVGKISIFRADEDALCLPDRGNGALTLEEYYDFTLRFAKQYKESGSTFPVFIRQSLFMNGKKKNFCCLTVKKPTGDCFNDALMCPAIFSKTIIQADGSIVPCSAYGKAFAGQGSHFGNVRETGLKELFTRGTLVDVLAAGTEEKLRKSETCAACAYMEYCQGGCPAMAAFLSQSMFAPDETKCVFFRQGYYEKYCACMEGWNNVSLNLSLLSGL